MICKNCGFQNAPGDEFCGNCGRYLEWSAEAGEGDAAEAPISPTDETQPLPPQQPPADAVPPSPPPPPPQQQPPPPPPSPPQRPPPPQQPPADDPLAPLMPLPAHLVRCPTCGTANERTRTFCQTCGTELKQAGIQRGRTALKPPPVATPGGDNRLLIALGAGLALALVFGAIVVFGGFLDGPPADPGHTPTPTLIGGETPTPTATGSLPTVTDGPSDEPPTDEPPTDEPATDEPATPTPAGEGRFSCATQTLDASTPGRWTVTAARWGQRGRYDWLAINLEPGGGGSGTGHVTAELVDRGQVQSRFGVAPPGAGDIALVVVFEPPLRLSGPFGAEPNLRVLEEFRVTRDQDRVTHAVLGVTGSGCFDLTAPGWESGTSGSVEVIIDIQR